MTPRRRRARPGSPTLVPERHVLSFWYKSWQNGPERRLRIAPRGRRGQRWGGAMSGLVVIAIGAVLCFLGVASIHLEVLLTGFAIGWLLAEVFGGSVGVSLVVGLVGALVVWVLATFVFKVAMFFLGGIGGLVIGSKLAGLLDEGDRDRLLTVAVVLALAAVGAFAADRYRSRRPPVAHLARRGRAHHRRALPGLRGRVRLPARSGRGLGAVRRVRRMGRAVVRRVDGATPPVPEDAGPRHQGRRAAPAATPPGRRPTDRPGSARRPPVGQVARAGRIRATTTDDHGGDGVGGAHGGRQGADVVEVVTTPTAPPPPRHEPGGERVTGPDRVHDGHGVDGDGDRGIRDDDRRRRPAGRHQDGAHAVGRADRSAAAPSGTPGRR